MVSSYLYTILMAGVAIERVCELRISQRNARWSFSQGGLEFGRSHYPFMVVLHTLFLIACLAEVWGLHRPLIPELALPMMILAILAQGLRWWVIGTLGPRWNTRVIVVPGGKRITAGPFRYLNHPNYLAVIVEGVALPLIHSAWITALVFSCLNFLLLRVRIRCEENALGSLTTFVTQTEGAERT